MHNDNPTEMHDCEHCDYSNKIKRNLVRHLWSKHSIGSGTMHKCEHCVYETKEPGNLRRHIRQTHDIGEKQTFKCPECSKDFTTDAHLKDHLWGIHDIGDRETHTCDQKDCGSEFKFPGKLRRHLWCVHSIGDGTTYECSQCEYSAKTNSQIKCHKEAVHDAGDKTCEYCIGKVFKLVPYKDPNKKELVKICRKCFKKATGYGCRAEEQMVYHLESIETIKPFIILKDRIISHDACNTRRRPDILISSGDLHIIIECDEHQHRNYSPVCESGRMDEIIDELKTGKIVFIRWNPDTYKSNNGKRKLRKERLKMLSDRVTELTQQEKDDSLSDHISVIYMFYDEDNEAIADRWKKTFIR
jgi:uncharacterized Zn-finger protein